MAPTNEAGRLAPVFLEAGTLVAYATPVGQQASVASSSSIAQLAPASELSDLDRTNWNALAIDGVYSYEEDDASNGYNLTSISTAQNLARRMRPADASLARRMEEACAGAECESFDRLVLQNNLIFVALPGISSSQIYLSCGGGGYTCCNFAETMLNGNTDKSLRGFGERHPETWQRLLGKGASSSIVMVSWDKAISTLFLNSTSILDPSTSERRGRLVAEALGMHVFWASAPISMLNDPCNHIMPTPYEINNEGLVEMRLNTVWGFGSRLGDVPSIWNERVPKVFYRGKRKYNSAQRGPLFEMGGDPANQVWLDAKDGDHQGPEVSGKHRYALDIGGLSGTTWNALRNKMRMGSLVLRVNSGMADWWHGSLIADQHYLPVKADLSDLKAQFDWAEAHPADAERIAEAGRAVEAEMSTVEAYDTHYERVLVALTSPVDCSRRLPDAGAWELAPTAQVKWTCGAGQRNADVSECLAAVVAATSGAANGHIKFLEAADVPPGCSFSRVSGAAMFNSGAGQVGSDRENYQLVCKPATSKGGDKVMPPHTRVRARAEALAHDPTVQAHDDSRYLPRLFAMSRAQCAGTQGNFVNGPTKPCNSRGPVCKSGATAASGNDAAVFKPDWAFSSSPCPADKRDAAESECLAAVQVAAKAAGLTDVRSHRMKVIDDVTVSIPSGCTYSPTSRQAIFNRNRVGGNGGTYQRVCADVQEAPDSQRFWYHFECAAYDSVLYIPYQGQGGLDDRIWMLSHASLLATSLCARVVTSTPSTQLPLKHNNWKKVDSRFWWDRYFDLGDLGDGRTIMVSDEERSWLAKDGTSSGDGSSDPLEASIFPQYRIGPSVAANVTEAYEEARMAAVAQTPFTWYADQHVWYPHFWLHKLADYDLGCDKGRTDDFTNPNLDSAFPEFNNGRPWSFFSESRQVRDHATAVLAKLGVHESDLHTLHVRRGDVAENCNTTAAYLALFMSRCDVLSPMKGDTEALVFFTDETDPKYLADLTAALSLPRWGGRVYNGDQAVMDVMGDEDKEDNYFVYAVASSVMASSTRQWEIRSTKGRCEAEDTCANPLMSKADAEAQLQSERREMLARVTSPGH